MKRYRPWLLTTLVAFVPLINLQAEPTERRLRLDGRELHYLEAGDTSETAVLLLHGARYSSQNWLELGTIDRLAEAGYHVVALDLPGYGKSQSVEIDSDDLLVTVLDALGIDRAVVVSPSMSGQFSFPLLTKAPERVAGFVPVAPAGIRRYHRAITKVSVPTLIVWGDNDTIVPLDESVVLATALSDSRRLVIEDAGHACYLDRPDAFHDALVEFLEPLR